VLELGGFRARYVETSPAPAGVWSVHAVGSLRASTQYSYA
jgi:hypothetical protein